MLSSVLRSKRAIQVNIQIMRVFTRLRELMVSHKDLARRIEQLEEKFKKHDKQFVIVFEEIKKPLQVPEEPKKTRLVFMSASRARGTQKRHGQRERKENRGEARNERPILSSEEKGLSEIR